MIQIAILTVFMLGYLSITLEHRIGVNKAASALVMGVVCWMFYALSLSNPELVSGKIIESLGEISEILFFLLGAMVIVELIDTHGGFEIITDYIRVENSRKLLWIIGSIAFFMSAMIDNLTTTIVMVSLSRKIIHKDQRGAFTGLLVIAANAGGAWSPIGDITTTMLWIKGQITAINIIKMLFLPSLTCLIVPLLLLSKRMDGNLQPSSNDISKCDSGTTPKERKSVLLLGVSILLLVPVFKTLTHLPPFMGMLLGLGIMWVVTEHIHKAKSNEIRGKFSVTGILQRIDTPSILFFLGILLAVSVLQNTGMLAGLAGLIAQTLDSPGILCVLIGLFSAVVDNVPLVAAVQGMYPLDHFPTDHYFWELLAYCAGTGGSALIIGSAAGVAAMGMENISFVWYLKRFSLISVCGFLAGAIVYWLQLLIFF